MNNCDECKVPDQASEAVSAFLTQMPDIRDTMLKDVQAAMDGDPSAKSYDDIILAYPCIDAIAAYRLAHVLYNLNIPLIPRIWTEKAHSRTGIDINPGASIGPYFFIDHGTGVVIGETCIIGERVAIYQGVTLGALAPAKGQKIAGIKRHPTIEDHVIIYAGATILGGDTVIGSNSIIGGNVWITQSVPPGTRVMMPRTELIFVGKGGKPLTEDSKKS
jgi:serine O-acetyltransferase